MKQDIADALKHPALWIFLAGAVAYVAFTSLFPEVALPWHRHEGPIEHAGHLVLYVALFAWARAITRALRVGMRVLPVVIALYLAFLTLEEIDFGHAYGVNLGATWIRSITGGSPNFHNAQDGHSGMLGWALTWIMLPLVAYFAMGLRTKRTSCIWPTRSESFVFGALCVLTLFLDGLSPLRWSIDIPPDHAEGPLGYLQSFHFAFWAFVGARVHRDLDEVKS